MNSQNNKATKSNAGETEEQNKNEELSETLGKLTIGDNQKDPNFNQYRGKSNTSTSINSMMTGNTYQKIKDGYEEIIITLRNKIENLEERLNNTNNKDEIEDDHGTNNADINNYVINNRLANQTYRTEVEQITVSTHMIHPSQPVFRGKSKEDVNTWLETLETNLVLAGTHRMFYVQSAGAFVRDAANLTYRQILRARPNITWDQFKREFRLKYLSEEYQTDLKRSLIRLKQTGSVESFINKFLEKANQCEIMDEDEKMFIFTTNVNKEIEGYIKLLKPKTLNETIRLAQNYAENIHQTKTDESPRIETAINCVRSFRPNTVCYCCGKQGHYAKDCYLKRNGYESDRSKSPPRYSDYNNKVRFENLQKQDRSNSNQYSSYKNNNSRYQRYRTPSTESYRSDSNQNRNIETQSRHKNDDKKFVKKRRHDEEEESMTIDIIETTWAEDQETKIDQMKTVATVNKVDIEVVIDSGATKSVMSEQTAQDLKLELIPTSHRLRVADGRIIPAMSMAKSVPILVHGVSAKLDIIIMPMKKEMTLLGADWLIKTGASINMKNQRITFGSRTIQLLPQEEDSDDEFRLNEANYQCLLTEMENEEITSTENSTTTSENKNRMVEEAQAEGDDKIKLTQELEDQERFTSKIEDLKSSGKISNHEIMTTSEQPVSKYPYTRSVKKKTLGDFKYTQLYFDDLLIYSETIDTHLKNLCRVSGRLKNHKLKLNGEKWQLFKQEESVAIDWTLKHFHGDIYGKQLAIYTDHPALQWLLEMKNSNSKLARWTIYNQAFNLVIRYRAGIKHKNVDTSSRPVLTITYKSADSEQEDSSTKGLDPYENAVLMHFLVTEKSFSVANKKQCKRIKNSSRQPRPIDGHILYGIEEENHNVDRNPLEVYHRSKNIFKSSPCRTHIRLIRDRFGPRMPRYKG